MESLTCAMILPCAHEGETSNDLEEVVAALTNQSWTAMACSSCFRWCVVCIIKMCLNVTIISVVVVAMLASLVMFYPPPPLSTRLLAWEDGGKFFSYAAHNVFYMGWCHWWNQKDLRSHLMIYGRERSGLNTGRPRCFGCPISSTCSRALLVDSLIVL